MSDTKARRRERRPPKRSVGRPPGGSDVRETLVETALRLLETYGDAGAVTVAAIVAEAGCTPPTLYNYWPKRELLLREAGARGFQIFRASQADGVGDENDPLDRIRRRGRAYLEFALNQPALFRVLFLDRPVPGQPPTDPSNPEEGLSDLVADVGAAMTAGQLRQGDPVVTAVALWGAVHGIAALWAATPGLPPNLARHVANLQQQAILDGLTPHTD